MARRSEHSREQLAEMVLQAAEHIVQREGFSGLSARKIATDIGYAVGTLYVVYENQDDIILHVNARTLDSLSAALREAISHCRQPRNGLLAMAHTYLSFSQSHSALWSMIFEHHLPETQIIPEWYQDKVESTMALVEAQLGELITKPALRRYMAQALWSGVHGIAILSHSGQLDLRQPSQPAKLIDLLINTLMEGLESKGVV